MKQNLFVNNVLVLGDIYCSRYPNPAFLYEMAKQKSTRKEKSLPMQTGGFIV